MKTDRTLRIAKNNLGVEATVKSDNGEMEASITFLDGELNPLDLNTALHKSENLLYDLTDLSDLCVEARLFLEGEFDDQDRN